MNRLWSLLFGFLGAAAFAFSAPYIPFVRDWPAVGARSASAEASVRTVSDTGAAPAAEGVAGEVAARCLPSVVGVIATTGDTVSTGSAVAIDADGDLLTNWHVVSGADSIELVGEEDERVTAFVVGADESGDLAVIRVEGTIPSLVPIEAGDSDGLAPGDWVMVLGSPFGLSRSCSTGIVSALWRDTVITDERGGSVYADLIQTDAAINPGNSGGALVNAEGELVGICSIIQSRSGSSSGVGFAIPANRAMRVSADILSGEPVEHAWLGVDLRPVSEAGGEWEALGVTSGALVCSLDEEGCAAASGIALGDVIVKVDGRPTPTVDSVVARVRAREAGETCVVSWLRLEGGEVREFEAEVALDGDGGTDLVFSGEEDSDVVAEGEDDFPDGIGDILRRLS